MDRYIGLDVHATTTTFAVLSATGKRVGKQVVETNGRVLVEQLKTIPGKRHVCLEEGTQSAWLHEILSPHAEQVVVTAVSESRGPESDERDAFALAERLRIGAIERRVYKGIGPYAKLRELSRAHAMIVQDTVRVQNRIKALYRSRGVAVGEAGKAIYSSAAREPWQEKLPEASRAASKLLYAQYDAVQQVRQRAEKELVFGGGQDVIHLRRLR